MGNFISIEFTTNGQRVYRPVRCFKSSTLLVNVIFMEIGRFHAYGNNCDEEIGHWHPGSG